MLTASACQPFKQAIVAEYPAALNSDYCEAIIVTGDSAFKPRSIDANNWQPPRGDEGREKPINSIAAPHASHKTNRADPSFRPPDLLWYKAALTEGNLDLEREPNWVSQASQFRWQSNVDDGGCPQMHFKRS